MTDTLHIDFETRSEIDLRKVGLHRYARDPSTDVICMAWAVNDEPVRLWHPANINPTDVMNNVSEGIRVVAHNVPFELEIWNQIMVPRFGWPELKPEQCECTMAMAYSMALPGALDNAAAALGLNVRKDNAGHRLMMQMCKPRRYEEDGTVVWWDDEDRMRRLFNYCKQDVEVERLLEQRLMRLAESERKVWQIDFRINSRGLRVDLDTVKRLNRVVDETRKLLDARMRTVTNNAVSTCTSVQQLVNWLRYHGVDTSSVAKFELAQLLERDDLAPDVRDALTLRQEAAKASVSKLNKVLDLAGTDHRAHGLLQFHGAATGRWAGRHIQAHNLPRPAIEQHEIEHVIEVVKKESAQDAAAFIDMLYGAPLDIVASCLRAIFTAAPGNVLMAGDYMAVEGRKLAWMAGEEWVLEVYRTDGRMYERNAVDFFPDRYLSWKDVDKKGDDRFVGKVGELQLGYQGGVGAFQTMARTSGFHVTDAFADGVKEAWRSKRPNIVGFWYVIEDAALKACSYPGRKFQAGVEGRGVTFKKDGSFLWCRLPSGRVLCYPYPELREVQTPWGATKTAVTYMTVPTPGAKRVPDPRNSSRWTRVSTYGGKLTENVVQASCADLLRHTLCELHSERFATVLHVHDEAVVEETDPERYELFGEVMGRTPEWAVDFPLGVETWMGERYRK